MSSMTVAINDGEDVLLRALCATEEFSKLEPLGNAMDTYADLLHHQARHFIQCISASMQLSYLY